VVTECKEMRSKAESTSCSDKKKRYLRLADRLEEEKAGLEEEIITPLRHAFRTYMIGTYWLDGCMNNEIWLKTDKSSCWQVTTKPMRLMLIFMIYITIAPFHLASRVHGPSGPPRTRVIGLE